MRVVAALAPARQTGYVQSFESNPASPKIWRPRTEGAPYLMVTRLPSIVAEAFAGGLAKSNSAMPIRAMKNLGVLISDYYSAHAARNDIPTYRCGSPHGRCPAGTTGREGIVKLRQISTIFWRARPTPGPQINKLAVVLGGESANKFPKLTIANFSRSF